jgi:2-dehydro-3-deoxyphosphogalactonate aldolase
VTLNLAPTPLVAILRGVSGDEADSIGAVLVEAGFGAIEVPLNSPDPFASIEIIARLFGDKCLVGAGTVIDVRESTRSPRQAGGSWSRPTPIPRLSGARPTSGYSSCPASPP